MGGSGKDEVESGEYLFRIFHRGHLIQKIFMNVHTRDVQNLLFKNGQGFGIAIDKGNVKGGQPPFPFHDHHLNHAADLRKGKAEGIELVERIADNFHRLVFSAFSSRVFLGQNKGPLSMDDFYQARLLYKLIRFFYRTPGYLQFLCDLPLRGKFLSSQQLFFPDHPDDMIGELPVHRFFTRFVDFDMRVYVHGVRLLSVYHYLSGIDHIKRYIPGCQPLNSD